MLLPVNVEPVPSSPLTAGAALTHPEAAAHRAQRPTHNLKVQVCLHPDSSAEFHERIQLMQPDPQQ